MKKSGVALTKAGNLRCMYVLHINAFNSYIGWTEILKKCFTLAANSGISSLSIPAIGTGKYGLLVNLKILPHRKVTHRLASIRTVNLTNPLCIITKVMLVQV